MKVLLLTPTALPRCTGNAVTVDRIARLLSRSRIEPDIVDLSALSPDDLPGRVRSSAPDLLHGFHAFKSGVPGLNLHERLGLPLITTLTGTDINVDLADPGKRRIMLEVLQRSAAVTVFQEECLARLVRLGIPRDRIHTIHQSVAFPVQERFDVRATIGVSRRTAVVLMLGGIRRVKRTAYAVGALNRVRRRLGDLRLIIAGPILEPKAGAALQEVLRAHPWVHLLGEVPRSRIRSLLDQCDVLLNTSVSESESNAVLEALSRGRVVIARDIPGNAGLKRHAAGLLFRNRDELERRLLDVLQRPERWAPLRENARRLIAALHRPAREKAAYAALYRSVLSAARSQPREARRIAH